MIWVGVPRVGGIGNVDVVQELVDRQQDGEGVCCGRAELGDIRFEGPCVQVAGGHFVGGLTLAALVAAPAAPTDGVRCAAGVDDGHVAAALTLDGRVGMLHDSWASVG